MPRLDLRQNPGLLRNNSNEYVGILAELLRLIIPARGLLPRTGDPNQPPDYKALLLDLQANGAIESVNHYVPGFHATGYRLAPDLRGRYHGREVTDPDLLARLREYADKEDRRVKFPVHAHLKRWLSRIE